jgi:excisionase family DNA binding protein
MDELLSVQEVARRLGGISVWTVRSWLTKGRMRRTKVGGRTMVRLSELQKVVVDAATPKVTEPTFHRPSMKLSRRPQRRGDRK